MFEKIVDVEAFEQAQDDLNEEMRRLFDQRLDEKAEQFRVASERLVRANQFITGAFEDEFVDDEADQNDDNTRRAENNIRSCGEKDSYDPVTCALEELEDHEGFHAIIEPDPECEVVVNGEKLGKNIPMPAELSKENFDELMCLLNRRQYVYVLNMLSQLKDGHPFYHFIYGCAGTGKSY